MATSDAILTILRGAERDAQAGLQRGVGHQSRTRRFEGFDGGVDAGFVVDILGMNGQQFDMNRVVHIRHERHARQRRVARVAVELQDRVALGLDGEQRCDPRSGSGCGSAARGVQFRFDEGQRGRGVPRGHHLQVS